uniref:NADH-ubiquinone oxidoreductase chain 1 n=1 Tax=Arrenurus rostratus TaxID=3136836 RepID=A0AAU6QE37_9ACAR
MIFSFLILIVFVLLSVAFFTVFEVKGLGYIHLRPGPNKVLFLGLFQPFSDFVKMFSKGGGDYSLFYFFYYFFSPFLGVLLGLLVWSFYYSYFSFFSSFWGILLFFFISSVSVYFLIFSGWSSGSVYSVLGSFRSSAQAVSYEVLMIFIFFCYVLLYYCFSFFDFFTKMGGFYFSFLSVPLFFCWFFSCLAESGRSPFDFSEGESELVSGFNTEYYGGMFVFIFLCEYSFIMFLCLLTSFFWGFSYYYLKVFFFCFLFVWVRSSFPRLRFDFLMMVCWKVLLPLTLGVFIFFGSFSFF